MLLSEFETHVFIDLLRQLDDGADSLKENHGNDERVQVILKRVDYLKWIFENSTPELISMNELNNLQTFLQNIVSHIQSPDNYPNIENWFSSIFAVFPYPRIQKIFRSEVNTFIDQSTNEISKLRETTGSFLEEVQNSKLHFDEIKTELEKNWTPLKQSWKLLRLY